MIILGISAFYHDSAACIIKDGDIIAAAQEERFTRKKHDASFPHNAIEYCLSTAHAKYEDIDYVVYYEDASLKQDRIDNTMKSFPVDYPLYKEIKKSQDNKNRYLNDTFQDIKFVKHHQSHAGSAFYPSPFQEAVIVTIDGVGEWETTTISVGIDNKLKTIKTIEFPDSVGLLYSAFTQYCGFRVNFGEYKLMGLAPYGKPKYYDLIMNNIVDLKNDGSFSLNLDYFDYCSGKRMINKKFEKLFEDPARKKESLINEKYCDIAASIQKVTEEIVFKICQHAKEITGMDNLCLAGGVALNCVSNGKINKSNLYKDIWIQPAAGDAGCSLGAALYYYYNILGNPRIVLDQDSMKGSLLGPEFSNENIVKFLDKIDSVYEYYDDDELIEKTADYIASGNVIGWHQGRMEFGPRALGNRSILGDPRSLEMQSKMNMKIKFRESFRPFAPSVLEEDVSEYFELDAPSPYMLLVANVRQNYLVADLLQQPAASFDIMNKVKQERSIFPAITHVDNSARIQTVNKQSNLLYYSLLKQLKQITGRGVVINTSFNVRGEPIVCTPRDAYNCFMLTNMDFLVIGNYVLDKRKQPKWSKEKKDLYLQKFELD